MEKSIIELVREIADISFKDDADKKIFIKMFDSEIIKQRGRGNFYLKNRTDKSVYQIKEWEIFDQII
ncbi:MAG: hypothetical protein ACRCUM_02610 [Mycoplasmoidaceae bacterium]